MDNGEKNRPQERAKEATTEPSSPPGPPPVSDQQIVEIQQLLNTALGHHGAGRLQDAEVIYRQILQIDPNQPFALRLLGVIAHQIGRNEDAAELISRAIAIHPGFAEAYNNLGPVLQKLGRPEEALANYRKALEINPGFVEAHNNLGLALDENGQTEAALASFRQALALKPDFAEAHNNLGNMLQKLDQMDEAVMHYRKALAIAPGYVMAHNNLGNALKEQERMDEAIASFNQALALAPNYAEAHNNLGSALQAIGNWDEAQKATQKAIELKPDFAEAHYNLGKIYREQELFDQAVASYNKALEINPQYAEVYNNLGSLFKELGDPDKAVSSYRQAVAADPGYGRPRSNLIFIQDMLPNVTQEEQQAERKLWNDAFIRPLADKILPHTNDRDPNRRLRIGYVSGDFVQHSASQGFGSLILEHDRENFEVFCYDGSAMHDALTETFKKAATGWREVFSMRDEEMAATIRADGIDILVDLSGHTRGNRLSVFGQKPAPVQVTGIGHLAPGVSTIDYRLTTEVITPRREEEIYPEKPVYLQTYFGFTPPPNFPSVGPSPLSENGYITYGFLGRHSKISKETVQAWARILADVPASRLLIKNKQMDIPSMRQQSRDQLVALGIDENRLAFLGKTDQVDHMAAHNRVDVVLDTFPHGGGITALECLWMGVPIIGITDPNKAGGRIAHSICQPLGLSGCIAKTPQEYYDIAVSWTELGEELAALRSGLREQVKETYKRFPDDVQQAYRDIWRRWCAGEAPTALTAKSLLPS